MKYKDNGIMAGHNCPPLYQNLLDSSLITTTNKDIYNVKLVNCGDYIQIYTFENFEIKKQKNFEEIKDKDIYNIKLINTDGLRKKCNDLPQTIELKNIIRSKLECQRLAKANLNDWKIFITLTFADNITDIKKATKRFRYFIDKIKRIKKDFKYLCITEFQKRGAIHYHLLCNIDINDRNLLYEQKDNKKFLHIKYWNDGFTSIEPIQDNPKKIIGYISKYMTKDIDNRLFNHKRYFHSTNLKKPTINYLNLNNSKHLEYFNKILKNKNIIYENSYINSYNNELINFSEFL